MNYENRSSGFIVDLYISIPDRAFIHQKHSNFLYMVVLVTTRSTSGALNVITQISIERSRDDAGWFCLFVYASLDCSNSHRCATVFCNRIRTKEGYNCPCFYVGFFPLKCLKLGYTACGLRNPNTIDHSGFYFDCYHFKIHLGIKYFTYK
jgi:hypothetical protein